MLSGQDLNIQSVGGHKQRQTKLRLNYEMKLKTRIACGCYETLKDDEKGTKLRVIQMSVSS